MSTIRVDKIMPFQSSSVEIVGSFNGTYSGSFSGSFVGDGSGLTGISGVTPINTGSFATTGSNTFVGDQDIQGTLTASIQEGYVLVGGAGDVSKLTATSSFGGGGGDAFPYTGDAVISGSLTITGSLNFSQPSTNITASITEYSGGISLNAESTVDGAYAQLYWNGLPGTGNPVEGSNKYSVAYVSDDGFTVQYKNTTNFQNSIWRFRTDGVLSVPGNITGAGNLAITGSNTFRGNQSISGSLTVSGSIRQNVGEANTFVGTGAGFANFPSLGTYNTFIGTSAGQANQQGTGNLAIGASALNQNILGDSNVAVGNEAGSQLNGFSGVNTGGTTSIFIGHNTQAQLNNQTNQIVIGHFAEGNGSNTTTIGNSNTTATYLKGKLILSGSTAQEITGSLNVTGAVSASSFTGSFIGDGSGLTGITSTLPSDILSSSVTNFTDYSQSVDTRISSIVTGTGFATTGSNTFVGNQVITGSLTVSGSNTFTNIGRTELTGSVEVDGDVGVYGNITSVQKTIQVLGFPSEQPAFYSEGDIILSGSLSIHVEELGQSFDVAEQFQQAFSSISFTQGELEIISSSYATTGSNTFVGNQVITGSLTMTGSITIPTGSITVPGSGSLVNFVANPSTMRSIRGNGAGLFNIVEQSDGNMTFTVSKIGLGDLTGAITSNISGSTINGSFSDNTTTTSGQGRGARLRGVISGGTVTSLQIETANSSLGYEEEGQPANRQGIGYKAGDTVTINQSLNQVTGSLTITLRQQDIDTYFGVHHALSYDYKQYNRLLVGGDIVTSGSITVGSSANTLGSINGNNIAAGEDVNVTSDYSIAVGRDLYNDNNTAYANATFGLHHSSSNYAQTIVGIASRLDDTGEGAFVVGNGTTPLVGEGTLTRSNLLVAQGNKVQVTGSLDVTGSMDVDGFTILSTVSSSYNFADDSAAASGGVPLGGLYHTSGTIKIRLV
jgi:hypothetical protein